MRGLTSVALLLAMMGVHSRIGAAGEAEALAKAAGLAKANRKTPEGRRYDAVLEQHARERYEQLLKMCVRPGVAPDGSQTHVLVKVSADGSISEALVKPASRFWACFVETLKERGQAPPPPSDGYWAELKLKVSVTLNPE